jgi:hypothetical protein
LKEHSDTKSWTFTRYENELKLIFVSKLFLLFCFVIRSFLDNDYANVVTFAKMHFNFVPKLKQSRLLFVIVGQDLFMQLNHLISKLTKLLFSVLFT